MTEQLASVAASAFIAAMFFVMPMLRRDSLFFGFHILAGWPSSPEARRIVRNYWLQIAGSMVAAGALAVFGLAPAAPVAVITGAIAAFVIAHRATRPHAVEPPTVRSASLAPDDTGLPGGIPAMLFPLAIVAGAAAWLHFHWYRIPESFPVHFDLNGTPNRWSPRTPGGVYGPLLIGAVSVGLIFLMALAVLKGSRRGGEAAVRFRRANLRALIGVAWLLSALFSWISLSPALTFHIPIGVVLVVFLVGIAALLVPVMTAASGLDADADNTPDAAWKLGMFYYNPADPALMVPRRFGFGYTVNLGNRQSWAILAFVGCLPLLLLVIQKAM